MSAKIFLPASASDDPSATAGQGGHGQPNRLAQPALDFQNAMALHRQGRIPQADALCAQVLCADPGHFGAYHLRGLIALAGGETERGIAMIESSLAINPAQPAAWSNLGNALVIAKRPRPALDCLDKAVGLDRHHVPAWYNRGNALKDLRRFAEALASYERALMLRPDHPAALHNRGLVLLELDRPAESLAALERAAQLDPSLPAAELNRAIALLQLQRPQEAARCFEQVLEREPGHDFALSNLFHLRMAHCDWTGYDSLLVRMRDALAGGANLYNPMSLLLLDAPELNLACARTLAACNYPPAAHSRTRVDFARRDGSHASGRIRVAYVSADFCDHPVSRLLVGTLEHHDRERFEVIGVSLREHSQDAFAQRVRSAFDRHVDASQFSDQRTAEWMYEAGVDIAVDLMGLTLGLRLGIFAHRAAPVQVGYLGYAGTVGAPYMDYILADGVVVPPGDECCYAESVVRLPHCYLPSDDRREIGMAADRARAGLPPHGLVFCAFTHAYKINPPVFDVWMRLLREVEGSVLWLRGLAATARENLRCEAAVRGVAPERLVFAPHMLTMADHLARHAHADLYLDTLPYNAHSTVCDALWVGVPAVSCAGRSFASRVASSALAAAGLPQLATHDLGQYERCALDLARRPDELRALRQHLVEQRSSLPLFDTVRHTRHLESAFLAMHARAARGEAPAAFTVEG